MILANLAKAIREQNYYAVFLEFVIVVVGVLLAFQISAWSANRANRALALDSLDRLASDLEMERANWQHTLDYYSSTRAHALRALEAYRNPPDAPGEALLIDLYQASQQWNVTARTGTYDELVATGRIAFIDDEDLRALLTNHYERTGARSLTLRDPSDYRERIRSDMDERVQLEIRARCNDSYVTDEFNYVFLRLPESCDLDLPVDLMQQEAERLLAMSEIQRSLRFHLAILESRLGTIENGVLTSEITLEAVREAIE
ncbi:DUF6090 family protein [Hyphobacterium sp. HN65]|uniref:DUF6090 family protein n=1 Tax=Hyphobacterium lacteum TaxID=3116575 RepID=A0ABU7LRR1_9PROT|nr:DUF6090 family protein [Hyphobacterium sp. HN65]MEE2526594.1 DUF6090 family protein [Hyphobacterium sp. HN65]